MMGESPAPIKTVIAEDHQLTRNGLVYTLEKTQKFQVVADVDNGSKALKMVEQMKPALVLMDIGMPVMDGITATQALKENFPNTKVLILTSHQDEEEVLASLAAGADAYCLKDTPADKLISIIEIILEGGLWLDPAIAKTVMRILPTGPIDTEAETIGSGRKKYNTELTDRELEVLRQIVEGCSNKEIAQVLDISLHTVKSHVCNIIQKLAVDDRTQAAIKALKEGLV